MLCITYEPVLYFILLCYQLSHNNLLIVRFRYIADLDPKNYQTLYSRATVYLAIGKSKAALPDLDLVIRLKPDFIAVSMTFYFDPEICLSFKSFNLVT